MLQASLAQSLPPELLEVILRAVVEEDHARAHLAHDAHRASVWNIEREKRFGSEWLEKQFLESSTALLPCLLVCKHWFPIASKLLYHAIDLTPKTTDGEDEGEDDDASCSGEASAVEKAESFYETVSTRPALAALVMSLKIGGQPILEKASLDSHAFATHSFLCIAALKHCTNVERLFVSHIAAGHKSRLLSKMRILKKLRVLDVGSHSSNKCGIAVFSSSDCRDLSMAPALQVLGLSWAPLGSELPTSLVACPAIRRLDLNKVAMTDAQFVATMARIGPTLETLFISQEPSGGSHGNQSWEVTYASIVAGLSHLTALEHLHVDISQEYDRIDLAATSPTLLAPLHRLKTVSVTPDTFPCSGLGHLTSPHLQEFRLFVFSGLSYPPIDEVALAAGVEAMIRTPATCPSIITIRQQIAESGAEYDEDGELEYEPETPKPLDPEIIDHLIARCAEVGVTFLYSFRFI